MLAELLLKIGAAGLSPDRPYHPTPSLAGPDRCIRQLAYYAQGVRAGAWGDRFASVLNDGQWHEELLKDWIRRSAYQLHSEQMPLKFSTGRLVGAYAWTCGVEINGRPCGVEVERDEIHGHIDGILTDMLGQDAMLEVKSQDHFKFKRLWDSEQIPGDNLTQVALYMRGVQQVAPALNRFTLVMKNRNTSQLIDHSGYYEASTDALHVVESVRSDGERKELGLIITGVTETAIAKLAEVESYRMRGALPPRPYEFGNEFPCSYCRWQTTCWDGYETEVAQRADHVELPPVLQEKVWKYEALAKSASEHEKAKKELKRELLAELERAGARAGTVPGHQLEISLTKRKGYTVKETTVQELKIRRVQPREGAA